MGYRLIFIVTLVTTGLAFPVARQYSQSLDWLGRYGYLPPPDPSIGMLQTKEGIEEALKEMQRFAGLKVTGILDEDTIRLMSVPRCSLPDIVRAEDKLRKRRRRRRYVLSGSHWHKSAITWSLEGSPSLSTASLTPDLVMPILQHALKVWSDVTPLNFQHVSGYGDIHVFFASSYHDDGYPFDGRGGTLAHAFFPSTADIAGDTHFDNEETWSYGEDSESTDLFAVAVHEFGHALGLSHSSADSSIMRPYYGGAVRNMWQYSLPVDDRLGIQVLYGKRTDPVIPHIPYPTIPSNPALPRQPGPPPSRPTWHPDPSLPDRCKGGYDAVANIRGEIFFFKGPYFWRVQSGSLLSFVPALIQNFWIGLPPRLSKVDAVYERRSDNHILFFVGNQYWVFKDTMSLPGYPHPLSEWHLRATDGRQVENVEAAFVWAHNGKTYLFSEGEYWAFDDVREIGRNMNGQHPRKTSLWEGVPSDPDDVISWGDGDTHFFKGNSYWILKRGEMGHEAIIPRSIAVDYMRCPKPPSRDNCTCPENDASMPHTTLWLVWLAALTFCMFRKYTG